MTTILFLLCLLLACNNDNDNFSKSETDEIRTTLKFPEGQSRRLIVDNINGGIDVVGYDGDEIQVYAKRTVYADTREKMMEAKERMSVLMNEDEQGRIVILADNPWRVKNGYIRRGGSDDYGFDADVDFEIRVPMNANFSVKTVNKGRITIKNMNGTFEVRNVNGGIEMTDIVGTGSVSTVNGTVVVQFKKIPDARCAFKTINGEITVEFPTQPSVDMNFKTFNGGVYTDFEVEGLPRKVSTLERHGKKTIYKNDKTFSVRVGTGGPDLSFETLNGDIHILKKEN